MPVSLSASLLYERGTPVGSVGIFTDLREKMRMEQRLKDGTVGADLLASYILYGEEGPVEPVERASQSTFVTKDGHEQTIKP